MAKPRDTGRGWTRLLAVLPGAIVSLLPSATCPMCIAAYTGVLSALGLGFLYNEHVLRPLIAGFLAVGIASVAWSTRGHRRAGPLVLTVVGSGMVVAARLIWSIPPLLYTGVALLVAASSWNLWLRRPGAQCIVVRRGDRPAGDLAEVTLHVPDLHCSGCVSQIGKVLRRTAGIWQVEADLTDRRLAVRYQPAIVSVDDMKRAMAGIGYASEVNPVRGGG